MREFRLGDGRGPDLANPKRESAAVVGGDLNLDLDLLALGVRLGDDLVGVFAGMSIQGRFAIRVPTHAALAFVGVPLGAVAATVQLVVRPLFWIWEAVPVNAQRQLRFKNQVQKRSNSLGYGNALRKNGCEDQHERLSR